MTTLLYGGVIVNEGRTFKGSVVIENDFIAAVIEGEMAPRGRYDKEVDATGSFILPGIIDEHVHFREPGLTQKGDIESESRAAAYGGVTSFFDMPNTNPQTTTLDALKDKWELGRQSSHVNYSFFSELPMEILNCLINSTPIVFRVSNFSWVQVPETCLLTSKRH